MNIKNKKGLCCVGFMLCGTILVIESTQLDNLLDCRQYTSSILRIQCFNSFTLYLIPLVFGGLAFILVPFFVYVLGVLA